MQIIEIDTIKADTEASFESIGQILFKECLENKKYMHVLVKEQRDSTLAAKYREEIIALMFDIVQNKMGNNS